MTDRFHIFIGTKAQYVKTAPLLRVMDARGVEYRLIDSGQHASLAEGLRRELGVRDPDHRLGGTSDVSSIPAALAWSAGLATRLVSGDRLRREVFGGDGGICVVHGDTPSTLLSTLMARRAGLRVAHLEAGLRSWRLVHPFPEELIRVVVMRWSDLLFAPDAVALANLERMRVRGRVIPLSGNTSLEAVRHAAPSGEAGGGPAVLTMHRVENLHRRHRLKGFVELAVTIAAERPTVVVLHEPTAAALSQAGREQRLQEAGVTTLPLVPHRQFVAMLAAAPLVVTDGGSVQEECALLGVPTLLWRDRTERPDGLGENVVLSHYDSVTVAAFLADVERYRRPVRRPSVSPSEEILDVLLGELGR
jgi:UDP-N-acetylglucosamine 2-epimerase (non-hydrolysing)